jgi:plasmid stabilization system protein ParE
MLVVRKPRVDADIDEQALYIARDSVPSALRFLEAVEVAIERIGESPYGGAVAERLSARH